MQRASVHVTVPSQTRNCTSSQPHLGRPLLEADLGLDFQAARIGLGLLVTLLLPAAQAVRTDVAQRSAGTAKGEQTEHAKAFSVAVSGDEVTFSPS